MLIIIKSEEICSNKSVWQSMLEAVREGSLVVFPTETVYGLGANAFIPEAVTQIYKVKGRPNDNPLIIHGSTLEQLIPLVKDFSAEARKLAARFWPGPLTMILPASSLVNKTVTGGLDTVALRIPSHPVALKLLKDLQVPLAAPSANISGKPSPTCFEHVLHDLENAVDFMIDGGPCEVGLESTVVDLSGNTPLILRPGGVNHEELAEICGSIVIEDMHTQVPRSPGMKYRHYAPEAEVILVEPKSGMDAIIQNEIEIHKAKGGSVAVLAFNGAKYKEADVVMDLGDKTDLRITARRLFSLLREMDKLKMDTVIIEGVETKGLGLAIMNRLKKAASKGR